MIAEPNGERWSAEDGLAHLGELGEDLPAVVDPQPHEGVVLVGEMIHRVAHVDQVVEAEHHRPDGTARPEDRLARDRSREALLAIANTLVHDVETLEIHAGDGAHVDERHVRRHEPGIEQTDVQAEGLRIGMTPHRLAVEPRRLLKEDEAAAYVIFAGGGSFEFFRRGAGGQPIEYIATVKARSSRRRPIS